LIGKPSTNFNGYRPYLNTLLVVFVLPKMSVWMLLKTKTDEPVYCTLLTSLIMLCSNEKMAKSEMVASRRAATRYI
jgi:hypothetical protein